ncbi:hypothetical protein KDA_32060 [Dictyobacter alpinus]|uniref:Uncharacterized protein n=1 Tax=Dictyobacter alpinus TaxID=2014873 RepID=A0A402B8T6_9CHLR|nr:hypothetical protein [Dictyobacter alpinus]GCE27722.1 hypothetical protein KDA_32060 [Dictyobacter alpinus]
MTDLPHAQKWLSSNKDNPAIQFLIEWITQTLQRPLDSVENIEIVPNNPDTPTSVDFVVSFTDGATETQTVEVQD